MQTSAAKAADAQAEHVKFTIERGVLLKALAHVQSVVERRGTIPVLSNVKLEARDGRLSLTATDMDLALVEKVTADVSEEGATTVPAHTLYDIIRKIPEGAQIEMQVGSGGRVAIRAGSSRFTLASLPAEEFPVMAEGELPHSFSLKAAEFLSLIEKPAYAMSSEETRYYLNGIYLHVAGEALRAVATDGHRLARVEVGLPAGASGMPGIIVPRKAIQEVRKLIEGGEGDVQIALSDTKIRVIYGDAVLVSKLIDGAFPDYERVIPTANEKMLEIDRKAFVQAVDRVSVIASERTRGIRLAIEKGKITLSASSAEAGSASEDVDATYGADALEIGFNARYVLDMMERIDGETAQLLLHDGASPVLVRDPADMGALYVIMPMRV